MWKRNPFLPILASNCQLLSDDLGKTHQNRLSRVEGESESFRTADLHLSKVSQPVRCGSESKGVETFTRTAKVKIIIIRNGKQE